MLLQWNKVCKYTVTLPSGDIIGQGAPILIAGPCALENFESTVALGCMARDAGATLFRGSAFKPRTHPTSFQGYGYEALEWHKYARQQHGLPIETEVIDPRDVERVCEYVDVLRIGARNMQNYALLQEVGRTGKPCILKRGFGATLQEWLGAAEYVHKAHRSNNVILCERGIRTLSDATRFTLDLTVVAVLKELAEFPIIVDPSHAAGKRSLVLPLADAALAMGSDGVMIEMHMNPEHALSDALQQVRAEDLVSWARASSYLRTNYKVGC